jgi:histone deacetylase complex regulatory component SIN3
VKQYFEKIKNAENPEKPKTVVDKEAVHRFVVHGMHPKTYDPKTERLKRKFNQDQAASDRHGPRKQFRRSRGKFDGPKSDTGRTEEGG